MLYTILCYHSEKVVGDWTPAQDATVMEKLAGIQKKLAQQGKLGPVVRLMPTGTATRCGARWIGRRATASRCN